jgi:hypothetical protein
MDELLAFLRAQLDEDERVARETAGHGSTTWKAGLHRWRGRIEADDAALIVRDVDLVDAEHIARWDPARVLAEVEAKRRVLDLHNPQPTGYVDGVYTHGETGQLQCEHCAEQCHSGSGMSRDMPDAPWPCPTVRLLAQPYAGRPGWREEWAA